MPVALPEPNVEIAPGLTSGQLEPDYSLIQPYTAFPKHVKGPTVWQRDELIQDTSRWQWVWSDEHIELLELAYDEFEKTGLDIPAINRHTFKLPSEVTDFLHGIKAEVLQGPGLALIKGLPVSAWPIRKTAAIYLGIGTVLGWTVSQNGKGHILGHVKDLGDDPTQIDKIRIYSTAARQFFHTDEADIVALLCLHRAKEGGESDVVSAHHLWNTLQAENPKVAQLLATPNWYFDRKGEQSEGQKGWVQQSVFYWHKERLISHYDPYFIKSVTRFVDAGLIPGHSPEQLAAVEVFEQTAQRLALHMILQVGDIQFVSNTHVFHARTAYVDYPPPLPRRHLLRLWLSVPVREGGWEIPYPDNDLVKRGGIQVNKQPEICPLEAE